MPGRFTPRDAPTVRATEASPVMTVQNAPAGCTRYTPAGQMPAVAEHSAMPTDRAPGPPG